MNNIVSEREREGDKDKRIKTLCEKTEKLI